jgi:transcriptional regulator with GAF, ATPase, and Fis domain
MALETSIHNCGALAEHLTENELFGYERDAFEADDA